MLHASPVLAGILIGASATVLMDIFLKTTGPFSVAGMGRWVGYLFRGRLVHADIGVTPPLASDIPLGWLFHYAVGIVYGVALVLLAGPGWRAHPTLLPAWALGIVTVGAGWFILQPCLGMGIAATRAPHPDRIRTKDLAAHTVFGIGLWLAALALR